MKPILFNTEMVRAILDGRKTVTRRVVKTKHKDACGFYVTTRKTDGAFMGVYEYDENEGTWDNPLKPPYEVNDILYVRETFFQAVGHYLDVSGETVSYTYPIFEYVADGKHEKGHWYNERQDYYMVKRPSIHMPKEVARIFLKVTGVRVERLKNITERQAVKEGFVDDAEYCVGNSARGHFMELWNTTIKKDQLQYYGVTANPYVWVIEFKVIDKAAALKEGQAW